MPSRAAARPWVLALLVVLVAASCSGSDRDDAGAPADGSTVSTAAPSTTTSTEPTSATAALRTLVCTGAPTVTDVGTISSDQITEASGLAAGRRNPGVWWVHNDSGDAARIFAIDDAGELLAAVELDGADAIDWEDLAIGPSVDDDAATIYVGDTGDNLSSRDSIQVYRFAEPLVAATSAAAPRRMHTEVDTLTFTYPGGAHDAEALVVDPISGELLIVTKDWSGVGASEVYRAPAGLEDGSTTELEHVATVPLPPGLLVTGADISPDGSLVALRSYGGVDLYSRAAGEPVEAAFASTPCAGPVPSETQGEAIGFAADGGSYLTVSEGREPVLHRTGP